MDYSFEQLLPKCSRSAGAKRLQERALVKQHHAPATLSRTEAASQGSCHLKLEPQLLRGGNSVSPLPSPRRPCHLWRRGETPTSSAGGRKRRQEVKSTPVSPVPQRPLSSGTCLRSHLLREREALPAGRVHCFLFTLRRSLGLAFGLALRPVRQRLRVLTH